MLYKHFINVAIDSVSARYQTDEETLDGFFLEGGCRDKMYSGWMIIFYVGGWIDGRISASGFSG